MKIDDSDNSIETRSLGSSSLSRVSTYANHSFEWLKKHPIISAAIGGMLVTGCCYYSDGFFSYVTTAKDHFTAAWHNANVIDSLKGNQKYLKENVIYGNAIYSFNTVGCNPAGFSAELPKGVLFNDENFNQLFEKVFNQIREYSLQGIKVCPQIIVDSNNGTCELFRIDL